MADVFTAAQNCKQPSCPSMAVVSKPRPSTQQLKDPLATGRSQGLLKWRGWALWFEPFCPYALQVRKWGRRRWSTRRWRWRQGDLVKGQMFMSQSWFWTQSPSHMLTCMYTSCRCKQSAEGWEKSTVKHDEQMYLLACCGHCLKVDGTELGLWPHTRIPPST